MSRRTALPRMVKLYAMLEKLQARERGSAAHALAEVERAQSRFEAGQVFDRMQAQAGLAAGSWVEASALEVSRFAVEGKQAVLVRLFVARGEHLARAAGMHRESATELKQAETLLGSARRTAAEQFERAAQAESDDRYLSRREWMRHRLDRERR